MGKKVIESQNLGTLYRHINSRMTHKDGIAPLKNSTGHLVTNEAAKAALLNEHFVNAGTCDNGVLPPFTPSISVDNSLNVVHFNSSDIYCIINKLNVTSSPGPDGICPTLLKNLRHVICYPLSIMFNLIFNFEELPSEWKQATVKPIFKKGSSSDLNNYRPISLTSIVCKIFETIIKNSMMIFFKSHSIISEHQHGFLDKHSTCTNLLECLNDWSYACETKCVTKVLYVDFAKAFESVSIPKLILKLSKYGISGKLFLCIKSFLTDRVQRVKVGDYMSSFLSLTSGVPQGSVLGPLLFLLYINDLPNMFDADFIAKIYADDLKSYNTQDYRSNPKSTQKSLNLITSWADTWQLKLSVKKCGTLLLKGKMNYVDTEDLFIGDDSLAVLENVKDLGVIIDCNLCFTPHIDGVISKAKQRIFLIFKSFKSRNIDLFIFAYKVYVLPILEYCSSVWSPSKLSDIDNLESVQRYYTKRLEGLWEKSYSERLVICNLVSLEQRRLISDLLLCFKIVNNLIDLKFSDFFEFDPNNRTRGHNFKLRIPLCKNNIRQNFFSIRVVPVWNSLPGAMVNSQSLPLFKNMLINHNLSSHLYRSHTTD